MQQVSADTRFPVVALFANQLYTTRDYTAWGRGGGGRWGAVEGVGACGGGGGGGGKVSSFSEKALRNT